MVDVGETVMSWRFKDEGNFLEMGGTMRATQLASAIWEDSTFR